MDGARLGRGQRAAPRPGPAPGRLPRRLLGRLGHVPQDALRGLRQRVREVHRPAASLVRDRLHDARRQPLGAPGVAARAAQPRARSVEAAASLLGAPPEPLERRPPEAGDLDELGLQQTLRPSVRAAHVPRPARLRLRGVDEGRAGGRVRPQHLPRHARLGLRAGLEAREQLPRTPRHGRLLLRAVPTRPVSRLPRRREAPGRQGHALPGDRRSAPASCPTWPGRAPRPEPTTRRSTASSSSSSARCTRTTRSASPSDRRTIRLVRVPGADRGGRLRHGRRARRHRAPLGRGAARS